MSNKKLEDLKLMLGLLQERVWDNEEKVKRCMECNLDKEKKMREINTKIKVFQNKIEKIGKSLTKLLLKGGAK